MKSSVKSIYQVLSANILITIIGMAQTFILPLILAPSEFGFWSYYLLYVSYAGFLIFGFCDGFYLKYGGEKYDSLDKNLFSSFHLILVFYLTIVLIGWIAFINIFLSFDKKSIVLLLIGIGSVFTCLKSYYVLLNQATARFSIYAKGSIIEKIVLVMVSLFCVLLPTVNSYYIILASIVGKLITIFYFMYFSKDVILSKPTFNKEMWRDAISNVKVGFTLTLSGVGTMLITGYGRFVVEKKLGIIELGYYSFMFSITILFTQLIFAISTVLFPFLRRIKEDIAKKVLKDLDMILINFSGIILLIYFPSRYILETIFPQYQPSMELMLYLFPIIIAQNRMMLVYNTLYKVLRYEKQMLMNVLIALTFSVIITFLLFWMSESKESIALATYIGFLFWNLLSINVYKKKEKVKISLISTDLITSVIFIVINQVIGFSLISFLATLIPILVTTMYKFKETMKNIKSIRELTKVS
ncbi:oligosaccharide flippase family protein [Rossellomorea marisflavi]|uniref:lipopolysaccharide biosynthesis protein n=1 Tax=Rossellomorea marisflavi TaxID=189381 RepID=UPI00203BBC32|nr:oligosaccharide flippase family protein [Rossellomorea marisflavi]MCM2590894.1 oligosaccharide flippase family protein [Rossellomorea marisflavi]